MTFLKLCAAATLTLILVACNPTSEPSGEVGTGPGGADVVKVTAGDTFFEPQTLELTPGDEVTIEITNEGSMPHDFAIEDLGLNTGTIEPGEIKTATFEVPGGTTEFVCTYHSRMKGTIRAD